MTLRSHPQAITDDIVQPFRTLCEVAGNCNIIEGVRAAFFSSGVLQAIDDHDDQPLFDWLMSVVSYQGIGDAVATSYMQAHGRIHAQDIAASLTAAPSCQKLTAYWTYFDCSYHKGSSTCAQPEHFDRCPLPRHDLRNGRLNQTAYSLFLFMRDVAEGDFVSWIDRQLSQIHAFPHHDRLVRLGHALLEPLGHIHGVSNKVLSMALADLLLAGGRERKIWLETGAAMIAIDSLVHNWMHRTGILARLDCDHPYGPRCYGPGGCAEIITAVSELIDARTFNVDYPADFPRFVQKAIWWFCARDGLNECNGNRIDDRKACDRSDCALTDFCDKRVLHGF